jgi:hypothetical protein
MRTRSKGAVTKRPTMPAAAPESNASTGVIKYGEEDGNDDDDDDDDDEGGSVPLCCFSFTSTSSLTNIEPNTNQFLYKSSKNINKK